MDNLLIRHIDFATGAILVVLGVMFWSYPPGSLFHDYGFVLPLTMAYGWSWLITWLR